MNERLLVLTYLFANAAAGCAVPADHPPSPIPSPGPSPTPPTPPKTTNDSNCAGGITLATGSNSEVANLAVDDTNLYWLSHPVPYDDTWSINAVPKAGGSATVLVSGETDVYHLLVIDGMAYYLRQTIPATRPITSELAAVPIDGSAPPTTLLTGVWPPDTLVSDGAGTLYLWQSTNTASLTAYSLADGSTRSIVVSTTGFPESVIADADSVYYDATTAIDAWDLAAGQPRPVAVETGGIGGPLGQDDTSLYHVPQPQTSVQSVPKASGVWTTVVSLDTPQMLVGAIQPTGTTVLWEELLDTPGCEDCAGDTYTFEGLFETPNGGGSARQVLDASCPVVPTQAFFEAEDDVPLAIDDTNVYWTDGTSVYTAPRL
jgi:hypothetical protein